VRQIAATLLFFAFTLFSLCASASEIKVRHAEIVAGEESWLVDAEFTVGLGQRLEEVVSHGVALYFVTEFALTKARWYWADEHVAGRTQTWRLAYNALTRQYRLSNGALHQSFATLEEALGVLARLRSWPVADKAALKAGETYNAALRMKLDLTQLPKPFQVDAIGNKDWNLKAEIRRWTFTVPAATEGPAK
jgi:Domain of unknown function (DUF4390)